MDGFALRRSDTEDATAQSPARLRIVGESRAGSPYAGEVGPGEAAIISTGAMLPAGADTVLRVEDAEQEGADLLVQAPLPQGKEIRRAGEDIEAGQVVLPA